MIARVIKPRGIRGEVACDVESDFPERFEALEEVTVWMPDDARRRLNIESHWFHKGRVILKFQGYDSMNSAQELIGGRLVISERDSQDLAAGEFLERDLIGSQAFTSDGRQIGSVAGLMRTGGTDVLVVRDERGRELLIPFADEICTEVDVTARRITISPPAGLLEL